MTFSGGVVTSNPQWFSCWCLCGINMSCGQYVGPAQAQAWTQQRLDPTTTGPDNYLVRQGKLKPKPRPRLGPTATLHPGIWHTMLPQLPQLVYWNSQLSIGYRLAHSPHWHATARHTGIIEALALVYSRKWHTYCTGILAILRSI